jgi:hypothetical protein
VLDLRPTALSISALPEELKTEQALRAHFGAFGDVSTVDMEDNNSAVVHFSTRKSAEIVCRLQAERNHQTVLTDGACRHLQKATRLVQRPYHWRGSLQYVSINLTHNTNNNNNNNTTF